MYHIDSFLVFDIIIKLRYGKINVGNDISLLVAFDFLLADIRIYIIKIWNHYAISILLYLRNLRYILRNK